MIKLKRAYDAVSRTDGTRFLVERLWPRGVSKAKLRLDAWLKEVGPSTALRKWFSHDPEKWREFRRRYFRELDSRPEAWQPITSAARRGTRHARVQLARYGAQQCGRVEGVRAKRSRAGRRSRVERPRRTGGGGQRGESLHGHRRLSQFVLRPVPPFRLDLTVWALRRRPRNLMDRGMARHIDV